MNVRFDTSFAALRWSVLTALLVPWAHGAVWEISPETVGGLSPTEQIADAVTKAAAGDTISFAAGVYQLDGKTYQATVTTTSSSGTITTHNYLVLAKNLNFVGPEGGHWDNAAILRGTGTDRFAEATSGTTFRNLTFENFASSDHPGWAATSGNLDRCVMGGAVYYSYLPTSPTAVSNCVFRGNVARSGGATFQANSYDCLYTNNIARGYIGGAALNGTMRKCTFAYNMATNSGCGGGAIWWPKALYDCTFVGNACYAQGGAVVGEADMIVSNCLFKANRTTQRITLNNRGGGAVQMRQRERFIDCRFEGNSTASEGGAIFAGASGEKETSNGGRGGTFLRCAFVGNASSSTGGAVYSDFGLANGELPFTDCVFSNNVASASGGAAYGGAFTNCTFVANSAGASTGNGGAITLRRTDDWAVGCLFASNTISTAVEGNTGVAIHAMTSNLVRRCAFVGNMAKRMGATSAIVTGSADDARMRVVDCAFTNNFVARGGIAKKSDCTNTVFFGNEVISFGGVVMEGRATDCRFIGNRKYDTLAGLSGWYEQKGVVAANEPAGDGYRSDLIRCEMDGGCITDCSLLDCTVHSTTNLGSYCAFYANNAVTNCLIYGCDPCNPEDRGLLYRWGAFTSIKAKVSEFVNCTFAENTYEYFLRHAQESGVTNRFLNCLFYNNKNHAGALVDVVCYCWQTDAHKAQYGVIVPSGLQLQNSVYGLLRQAGTQGHTTEDLGGNLLIAPEALNIVGKRTEKLKAPFYSLRWGSPALGKGDAALCAEAADLAGAPRLRGGAIDPGCYATCYDRLGLLLLVK